VEKAKARVPNLEVRERDLVQHPELGPRYGVMATPAIVINGRLEFGGLPNERAFLERLEAIAAQAGE
jgi:protein-disulfide isomerase